MSKAINGLGPVEVNKKTGAEPFHQDGQPLGFDVLSFWQWSSSDLLNNAMRGILAEYLVARAVGSVEKMRVEWDSFDVTTPTGVRIEVKSAAYLQSWHQTKLSAIIFSTRPTQGWDGKTNTWDTNVRRQADVYVFCLLAHQDKATVDPLNVAQWRFFVISSTRLDTELGAQKSVGLAPLLSIGAQETAYDNLAVLITEMSQQGKPVSSP